MVVLHLRLVELQILLVLEHLDKVIMGERLHLMVLEVVVVLVLLVAMPLEVLLVMEALALHLLFLVHQLIMRAGAVAAP